MDATIRALAKQYGLETVIRYDNFFGTADVTIWFNVNRGFSMRFDSGLPSPDSDEGRRVLASIERTLIEH